MKKTLTLTKYSVIRLITIATQMSLSLYLALFWDKINYAKWVGFQTQFALLSAFSFGFPVYLNKYTEENRSSRSKHLNLIKLAFPLVIVFIIVSAFFNNYFLIIWAFLSILYLALNNGLRSKSCDLPSTLGFLVIPICALVVAVTAGNEEILLKTYVISYALLVALFLYIYTRQYFADFNSLKCSYLEMARLWGYNLGFYGVYEFIRNNFTQAQDITGKVSLGYVFIVLSAVIALWGILSSYFYPRFLKHLQEESLEWYRILKIKLYMLSAILIMLAVSDIVTHFFRIDFDFGFVYLYIVMSLAGIFGTMSVAKDELNPLLIFCVSIIVLLATIYKFWSPDSLLPLGFLFFTLITIFQIFRYRNLLIKASQQKQ